MAFRYWQEISAFGVHPKYFFLCNEEQHHTNLQAFEIRNMSLKSGILKYDLIQLIVLSGVCINQPAGLTNILMFLSISGFHPKFKCSSSKIRIRRTCGNQILSIATGWKFSQGVAQPLNPLRVECLRLLMGQLRKGNVDCSQV